MVHKKIKTEELKKKHRNILEEVQLRQDEQERIDQEPSLYKQNYGWITLGGALLLLSLVLLLLLFRNQETLAVMITFSVLSFIAGVLLVGIPLCLTRYRLSSIPLIEAMGKDEFEDFQFVSEDDTLDQAIRSTFGPVFYDKLTEKKELEVLKGKDKGRHFVSYDFKAVNDKVSSAPRNIEGTLIRVYRQEGIEESSYASVHRYSDLFSPLEKCPIGSDDLIYFGKSKDDIQKHVEIDRIKRLGLPFCLAVDPNSISVLLFGKTIDVRRIKRGSITQEKYEGLSSNLYPLGEVLNAIL